MYRHKIESAFTGKGLDSKRPELKLIVPNIPEQQAEFLRWMEKTGEEIGRAETFVFENLPLTIDDRGQTDLPGLSEDELDMFSEGLVPLPFDLSWFEIPTEMPGNRFGETFCYLLRETEEGYVCLPFRVSRIRGEELVRATGEFWVVKRGTPGVSPPHIEVADPFGGARLFQEQGRELGLDSNHDEHIMGEVGFIGWLLLMLISKSTEIDFVDAPEKLNKQRSKKGRPAIPAHRVVSIVPRGLVRQLRHEDGEEGYMLRASPRLHWRRSHRRTLSSGEQTVVARHLVGLKSGQAPLEKDYRVKL